MINFEYYENYTYTDYDVCISSLKHHLKTLQPKGFLQHYSTQPNIYMHAKLLYLVSMIEHLCNHNNLQRPEWIYKYRDSKMPKILFQEGSILYYHVTKDESKLVEEYNNCIEEFKHHNIVETCIDNVF